MQQMLNEQNAAPGAENDAAALVSAAVDADFEQVDVDTVETTSTPPPTMEHNMCDGLLTPEMPAQQDLVSLPDTQEALTSDDSPAVETALPMLVCLSRDDGVGHEEVWLREVRAREASGCPGLCVASFDQILQQMKDRLMNDAANGAVVSFNMSGEPNSPASATAAGPIASMGSTPVPCKIVSTTEGNRYLQCAMSVRLPPQQQQMQAQMHQQQSMPKMIQPAPHPTQHQQPRPIQPRGSWRIGDREIEAHPTIVPPVVRSIVTPGGTETSPLPRKLHANLLCTQQHMMQQRQQPSSRADIERSLAEAIPEYLRSRKHLRSVVRTIRDLEEYMTVAEQFLEQYGASAGNKATVATELGLSRTRFGELRRIWEAASHSPFSRYPGVQAALAEKDSNLRVLIKALEEAGWKKKTRKSSASGYSRDDSDEDARTMPTPYPRSLPPASYSQQQYMIHQPPSMLPAQSGYTFHHGNLGPMLMSGTTVSPRPPNPKVQRLRNRDTPPHSPGMSGAGRGLTGSQGFFAHGQMGGSYDNGASANCMSALRSSLCLGSAPDHQHPQQSFGLCGFGEQPPQPQYSAFMGAKQHQQPQQQSGMCGIGRRDDGAMATPQSQPPMSTSAPARLSQQARGMFDAFHPPADNDMFQSQFSSNSTQPPPNAHPTSLPDSRHPFGDSLARISSFLSAPSKLESGETDMDEGFSNQSATRHFRHHSSTTVDSFDTPSNQSVQPEIDVPQDVFGLTNDDLTDALLMFDDIGGNGEWTLPGNF